MRILFIVPYTPTPIRVRPYNLLKTLVERGHRVTLATLWRGAAEQTALEALGKLGIDLLARPLPRRRSLANCLAALPSSTPLQAVYCWQPALQQALDRLPATEDFDVVHVEHLRGARYGLALRGRGVPIVWDSVDCISYLFEQAVAHSRSPFGKWITRLELNRTRRYEGRLVDQFDTVLVTSEIDRQALIQLEKIQNPKSKIQNLLVLPNGVDLTYFTANGRQPEADTLVFSGKMSYHANVTMALHLVQDIMPCIWAERPAVKLTLAGQNPPPPVQALGQDPRVTVTGYVPDIRPYLQQAAVAVAPSVYGAGIQNKVLEAMACGLPVVATERAIAALGLQPGRDLLAASEPAAFAGQVLRLLADPDLRRTIGGNGRRYVQSHHAWPQMGARLEEIYREVAA
ncbi:MAG: glycosyltransferase, partial [Anaerolineae bacterium]